MDNVELINLASGQKKLESSKPSMNRTGKTGGTNYLTWQGDKRDKGIEMR